MASNAATKAVILNVLNRHLNNKPHERAEITINEAKHEIVGSELDFLVKDPSSPLVAARVILTLRDVSGSDGDRPTTELAAHIITNTTTSPDPSSSPSTSVILDEAPPKANNSGASTPTPPHRASTIPTHPPPTSTTSAGHTQHQPSSLADTYREYISTFMANTPETAVATLPQFLHQPVTHNRQPLSVSEYHGLVQSVRATVPDLRAEIVELLADEGRGVVAARLEFRGSRRLVRRPLFAGGVQPQPPADEARGLPDLNYVIADSVVIRPNRRPETIPFAQRTKALQ